MAYNNKFYLGDYVRVLEINELMDKKSDNKAWINSVNVTGETPLHIAARRRILDLFESMLPHYDDIEACDDQGNTVLHRLVDSNVESDEEHKRKRVDLLRTVISRGADVNRRNKHGSTPAHLAAKHCHVEILEILKEGGADFGLRADDGETPLLLACEHMFKLRGTEEEANVVDFLVKCDCDVDATDEEGYSALHYAVELCSSGTVSKLIEAKADVNVPTKEKKLTPLHLAAKRKKPTKIDILMKAGANLESDGIDGLTPLFFALLESTPEVVERLIDGGSDMSRTEDVLQFSPMHVAVYQQHGDLLQLMIDKGADVNGPGAGTLTPLHLSSMLGDVELAKTLIDRGADVNCRYANGFTPLHLEITKNHRSDPFVRGIVGAAAITHGKEKSSIVKLLTCKHHPLDEDYEAVVRILIENGADVDAVTGDGDSPLLLAVRVDVVNVAKLLLEKGADVNALTKDGKNALHLAVESKSRGMVGLLVENGVNLNCKESVSGFTPLQLASRKNFEDAAKILTDAGAEQEEESSEDVIDIMKTYEQGSIVYCSKKN